MEYPLHQAAMLIISCLLVQLIALVVAVSLPSLSFGSPWIISGAFTLFYAFLNALLLLNTEQMNRYFSHSFYGYFLVLFLGAGMAYVFALANPASAESMRFIYGIITFSYFIFLTIVFFMRKIIEYAQRQDTEHQD